MLKINYNYLKYLVDYQLTILYNELEEVFAIAISYKPFIDYIEKRGMSVNTLLEKGVYTDTTARLIRKGEPISLKHIDAICRYLDLPIEQVVRITKD